MQTATPRLPPWLPGLLLALTGFAVWTLFSLWPWPIHSGAAFRIREAWDTAPFWRVGVPLMVLAQAAAGALVRGRIVWQPAWILGGLFAGVLSVHPGGADFSLFPLSLILIGAPSYLALLAATAIGRTIGDFVGV